ESQLKSYWATLIFSGKGTPPKAVGDAGDVKAIVAKNPSAIGYIDKRFADNNVKIIPLSR
ncbi:MAG: phosphate ABC transporter substrate-binding protein, partial [Gammaproteobacteria bacterium]|nr:phosphate ABC transporter substrate-binding protein [Gammaproteobacteria bacterium]